MFGEFYSPPPCTYAAVHYGVGVVGNLSDLIHNIPRLLFLLQSKHVFHFNLQIAVS